MLIAILMVEVGLRLFIPVTDVPFYFWDPAIGPRREPNQEGVLITPSSRARYHFNAQGWNHEKDYVVPRSPGTLRIALVGDSQVESLQVDLNQAIFTVAERRMNRQDRPVQWYAFGVSGFGTSQEYEVIRRYALDYRPDVVILLFVQNDPFDSSPYLVDTGPYFVIYSLDKYGKLVWSFPARVWRPARWRRLAAGTAIGRYLWVQQMLGQRLESWFSGAERRSGVGGLPLREPADVPGVPVAGPTGMSMKERERETWALIEALFRAARDECRMRGTIFGVAFRGWPADIDAPLGRKPERPLPTDEDPYCLNARVSEMGREFVGPIAGRLGIPYVDLTEALRAQVVRTGKSHRFLHDNHYNALGHRAAGEALAEFAEEMLQTRAAQEESTR